MLCYIPRTAGFPTAIYMGAVVLVLLSKLYLFQNIIRNDELVQIIPITKSCNIIETVTVHNNEPLRGASTQFSLPGLHILFNILQTIYYLLYFLVGVLQLEYII